MHCIFHHISLTPANALYLYESTPVIPMIHHVPLESYNMVHFNPPPPNNVHTHRTSINQKFNPSKELHKQNNKLTSSGLCGASI